MAKLSYRLFVAVAICAVAASAWEPPKLPAGRRVQYYILRPNGNFAYGYDTGEGVAAWSSSDSGLSQQVPAAISQQYHTASDGWTKSDASYSFSYDAGDHSRSETADKDGSVRGNFAFTANDGKQRTVDYEAGAATGFLARGSHLPTSEEVRTHSTPVTAFKFPQTSSTPIADRNVDKSYSFAYTADDHSREESADASGNVRGHFAFVAKDGVNRKVEYEAGAEKGFVAKGLHIPVAVPVPSIDTTYSREEVATVNAATNVKSHPTDGSYSFQYNAGDHSRQESADAVGNVQGSFSFLASDGINREVNYEAGAEKGFIAKGSHIPVAAEIPASAPAIHTPSVPAFPSVASYHAPIPVSQIQSSSEIDSNPGDASYSFGYDAGDHSRQESSDHAGNIKGHYSFVANDGVNRKVDYEAGANRGFIAKGAHIPVPPQLPSSFSSISIPSNSYSKEKSVEFQTNSNVGNTGTAIDKSYSFFYDAGDHSRQETADSSGNVRGKFSFVAKDGVNRKVSYEAGANTGFLATGAHIPTGVSVAPKSSSVSSSSGQSYVQTSKIHNYNFPSAPLTFAYSSYDAHGSVAKDDFNHKVNTGDEKGFHGKGEHLPVSSAAGNAADLSYKYSYETDNSKKTEESDSAGNVFGSFSYIGPDGLTRKVDYRAGGKDGFVPTLSHEQGSAATTVKQIPSFPALLPLSPPASSFPSASFAQGHSQSQTKPIDSSSFSVRTFLPHISPTKFGYIYDTLP